MNFIVESGKHCISDKGRIYKKFKKKSTSPIQHINMGTVRPESNAPINSIEINRFRELMSDDLRDMADLVDKYVMSVYGENPPMFVDHTVGITGS